MEQPLKKVLQDLLKTYHLDDKLNEIRVVKSWEKLMGKAIAKYTTRIYLSKKKLYIYFGSAALREELSYAKQKIIDRINEEMGEEIIEDVVFK